MSEPRRLLVIADDFGIGPETSRGILDLARRGRLTGTVLLVNSPHAAEAVAQWRAAGQPLELGWHPNLTLDYPVAPLRQVPSLVNEAGSFFPLSAFLTRLFLGLLRPDDLERELRAQWHRFITLVGHPPRLVASHQHVALFPPIGRLLMRVLQTVSPLPYLRNVVAPWSLRALLSPKRFLLNLLGRRSMTQARRHGFPGAGRLLGVTSGQTARDADFFLREVRLASERCVELMCHPGHLDATLTGRDDWHEQRPRELELLASERFVTGCHEAGFVLARPGEWLLPQESGRNAA